MTSGQTEKGSSVDWHIQQARQQFDKLVQMALDDGPQVITHRGEEAVVVMSAAEFRRLTSPRPSFKAYLLSGPDFKSLDLERRPDMPRDIDL
jgi:antitoxin Phd